MALAIEPSAATTYYVSRDEGNDKHDGRGWETAFSTLNTASQAAQPGDTVLIRKSETPYSFLQITRSGTHGNPIIFRGESSIEPPVISGAVLTSGWVHNYTLHAWQLTSRIEPARLSTGGRILIRASSSGLEDGDWFWEQGKLFLTDREINPENKRIWSLENGGGIAVADYSWIVLENLYCWMGRGACISIKGGSHIHAKNIHAKWQWRGIDIRAGGHDNLIENSVFEENREGAYIRNRSSNNTIRSIKVLNNGNPPLWTNGDRHAIAIGEKGPNLNNVVEDCVIVNNGGPPDNVALIAFRAPYTVFRNNHIHNNYGSGVFVTTNSDYTKVIGNRVHDNGFEAIVNKIKGIAAVSVRNSHSVEVIDNHITDNHVSRDSIYKNIYRGPHGGLDIDGHNNADMRDIVILNNTVEGTMGGPDIHISRRASVNNIKIQTDPNPVW